MQLDPRTIDPVAVYKLLISSVVPRPIAWVSSVDAAGVYNLAPFSYFMAITDTPPTIAFSCSAREAGKEGAWGSSSRGAQIFEMKRPNPDYRG